MRNTVVLLLTVLFFSFGCTDRDDTITAINIRIKNNSSIPFDKVQVGDVDHIHTDITPNSFSEYLEYETAYRYAYIQIESGSENYVLQPIDFVGEIRLSGGFYTYELDITESGDVSLKFITD